MLPKYLSGKSSQQFHEIWNTAAEGCSEHPEIKRIHENGTDGVPIVTQAFQLVHALIKEKENEGLEPLDALEQVHAEICGPEPE